MSVNKIFWFGCILTRLLIAYLAYILPPHLLQYMGYITLIPAFSFIYMYIFSLKKSKNSKGFFKGNIWWKDLRPLHGVLYLLFSIYAIRKKTFAYKVLLLDTSIGGLSWILNYYNKL